jgi:hypothetical protein
MVLPEGIDRLGAGGAVLRCHFIEPIEQRQDLTHLDPGLPDLVGYIIGVCSGYVFMVSSP